MGEPSTFGRRVAELRKSLGISQEQMAHDVGVTKGTIRNLERGHQQGTGTETLAKMVRRYSVSADWLIGVDERSLKTVLRERFRE